MGDVEPVVVVGVAAGVVGVGAAVGEGAGGGGSAVSVSAVVVAGVVEDGATVGRVTGGGGSIDTSGMVAGTAASDVVETVSVGRADVAGAAISSDADPAHPTIASAAITTAALDVKRRS